MKQANHLHLNRHVVVWLASLPPLGRALTTLEDFLDQRDKERATRFRFADDRARFVLGRRLLAGCLSRHLGYALQPLELALTSQGRPVLPRDPEVQFSISHTRDWVAVALSIETLVGVDLEYRRPDLDPDELAPAIFSPADLEKFRALPQAGARAAFFQAWTGKEAYLKARGVGISGGIKEITVPFFAQPSPCVLEEKSPWRLQSLPVPEGYVGNVAWNDPAKGLDIQTIDVLGGKLEVGPADPRI